jgi:hypothetical protein
MFLFSAQFIHLKVREEACINADLPMCFSCKGWLQELVGESRSYIKNYFDMSMDCFPTMLEFIL